MARPRADGTPARAVNRRKLTDLFVTSRKAAGARRADLGREAARAGALGPDHRQEGVEGDLSLPRPAALAAPRRRQVHRAGRRAAAGGAGRCSTSSRAKTRRPSARPSALTGTFADLASQYVELLRQEAQQELEAGRDAGRAPSAAALGQAEGVRHHPRRRPRR